MRWSLRAAESDDAPGLLAVVQAGFDSYRAFQPDGWTPPDESKRVENVREELGDADRFTMVAEAGGAIVGVVHWTVSKRPSPDGTFPSVHLRYLFVSEPFWGTGLALELHALAVEAMDGRDARLFTPEGHARARAFYEREGWRAHDAFFEAQLGMRLVEYRR